MKDYVLPTLKKASMVEASIAHGLYTAGKDVVNNTDGSPLPEADTQVNEFLKSNLLSLSPAAGWLSEDTTDSQNRLTQEWTWAYRWTSPKNLSRVFLNSQFVWGWSLANER